MTDRFKIIFFDLDGTLLTSQFELLPGTLEAVNDIRSAGFRISIATGRSYISASPFLEKLNIIEPMVFSNGSVVDNPDTGERELIAGIPLETALIITMLMPEYQISYKVHMPDGTVYKSDDVPWPDEGTHFGVGIVEPNLKASLVEDPVKLVFYDEANKMEDFTRHLTDILGRKSQVRWFKSHIRYVEMTNKRVSKGAAILNLVEKFGIDLKEVIAVGDQNNDLEMIRDAGLGIVAGSGTEDINAVRDHAIPAPEDGGIEALRDWLLA